MFSVLRIESDERRASAYVSRINAHGPTYKAHIDRRGCIVADLARVKGDWSAHLSELSNALAAIREVLVEAHTRGDRAVVDIALYPRANFAPGTVMAVDAHRFPAEV